MINTEALHSAISTIVDSKIKNINFDLTQSYTVSRDSNRLNGEYQVTNGAIFLTAYSDRTDYVVGDEVYVLTPENETENPRFIIGKKNKVVQSYVEVDPYENLIEVERIQVSNIDDTFGLIANDEELTFLNIDNIEDLQLVDYDSFGVSAEFLCNFSNKNVVSGNYGLRIAIQYDGIDGSKNNILEKNFDSNSMIGNPYNFEIFTQQKIVFPIKNTIKKITNITVDFYQNANFKNGKGEAIEAIGNDLVVEDLHFDIQVKNISFSFGYDIHNIQKETIKICCKEKLDYSDEDLKPLQLRWIHFEDGHKVFINQDTYNNTQDENLKHFLRQCEIRWYRYNNSNISNVDEYGGLFWERIIFEENSSFLPMTLDFTPANSLQQENLKVVIIKKEEDTIEEIFNSDIITFVNQKKVADQAIINLVTGFNLRCEDNSFGNYYLYDLTNQILDYNYSSQIRELTCYNGDNYLTSPYKIEWKFPKFNTMLVLQEDEKNTLYKIDKDSDLNYYILTLENQNLDKYFLKYSINSNYKESLCNNTITCTYWTHSSNFCPASLTFNFGSFGTNGTDSTLILSPVKNKAISTSKNSDFKVQAFLQDSLGQMDTNNRVVYSFSLHKPYNLNKKTSLSLTSNYNICNINYLNEKEEHEINILKCKVEGYGDYHLITYYPIPMALNHLFSITGATRIIYDSSGKAIYDKTPYRLYDDKGREVDCFWKIITEPIAEKEKENFKLYIPKIEDGYLKVSNLFISNCPLFAVQAYKVDNDKETILYTQPILVLQNSWFSQIINEWDGHSLGINEEQGYILSKMLSAGRKNNNNEFSGVLLGDWSGTNSQDTISKNTGLYGFHNGNMSFYFKDDGTAAIGKAGVGQLQFDGNTGTIQSGLYQTSKGKDGAYIDMTSGKIILANSENGQVVLNASSKNIFKTNGNGQIVDKNGNPLLVDENGAYYYINDEKKIFSSPERISGFPIIVSKDGTEENAKFKVAWDGTMTATNGVFNGMINAQGGNISGDFNVNGTLKGAIIQSGNFKATYFQSKSKIEYSKATSYSAGDSYFIYNQQSETYNMIPIKNGEHFNELQEKYTTIFTSSLDPSTEINSDNYPIEFYNDTNYATCMAGMGFVPGSDASGTTNGFGIVSLSEKNPLIFDARGANAKVNSKKGIFLTLDETANNGQAGLDGKMPYISFVLENENPKLIFGNFKKYTAPEIWFDIDPEHITIGKISLKGYIEKLINENIPKPE